MTDERTDKAFDEGVQFYRKRPVRVIVMDTLAVFVCFVFMAVFIGWAVADAGARKAHKEARDIRRALISVGTEYYAESGSLYDPSRRSGLSNGAADRIAELSTRNGDVILYSWDDENNKPLQFEYRIGMYRVIYTDSSIMDQVGAKGEYEVYYSIELLTFEAE
ncbi:MAG: hypothetical protein K6F49_02035 [Saccharofermentans sp.]|nr:hypothetical protein [Saccharofermentans sp.]